MIKTLLKWLGAGILFIIVSATALGLHEWHAEKPLFFRAFLDRTMLKMAFESPETLTSLGFLESMGIKGHNAKLDDNSPEKETELYDKLETIQSTLLSYEDQQLDEDQRLSKEIALYLLDLAELNKVYRHHNYPVNQLFGVQNGYPSFMDGMHKVTDLDDADHYIARLKAVKQKFAHTLEGLKIREQKGIIPPRFVIDRVLEEMNNFVKQPVEENILYLSLKRKMDENQVGDAQEKLLKMDLASQAIKSAVYPAYQMLIDYFTELKDQANDDDGFWKLPDGEHAYKLALSFFTTTDYEPDTIHQLGIEETQRIQSEIIEILAAEGYDTSQGFTAAIEALKNDERFYYPDTDEGRAQILKDYQAIIDEISEGLDSAFRLRPKAGMEVVRIPEFKEKTSPGAYYQQPAIDGSRPGRFYANLYDIKATPKYGMRTLAYHEGVPGHHFQIALGMETEGLPFFRRMSPFTAYTEGWALYTEQLAWELGFQDDPFDNVGRLQAELFRAVRLVVDTGIHAKKWTRQQAIDYMLKNTGMAESDVVSEIERYIVLPGQATAYKVGMIKILELREKAKTALGDRFDLRDFHDVVLKNGAVPLDILERLVDQYIAEKS